MADKNEPKQPKNQLFNVAGFFDLSEEEQDALLDKIIKSVDGDKGADNAKVEEEPKK